MEGSSPRFLRVSIPRACRGLLPVACLLLAGCSGLLDGKKLVHADPRGTVALAEVIDWSFQASHPSTVDTGLIARTLQGVRTGSNAETSGYTPADITALAPKLAMAFARAKPEHVIAFEVSPESARQTGLAGGTLYLKGLTLYLTPIPQGARSSGAWFSRATPSAPTAHITFEPRSLATVQKAASEIAQGYTQLTSFGIDHAALARLPQGTPGLAPESERGASQMAVAPAAPPVPPQALTAEDARSKAGTPVAQPAPTASQAGTQKSTIRTEATPSPASGEAAKPGAARKAKTSKPVEQPKALLRPQGGQAVDTGKDHRAILEVLKRGQPADQPAPTK